MKCAVMSDLHLEFSPLHLENKTGADVLILAGDIFVVADILCNKKPDARLQFDKFCKNISKEYDKVIVIAGNHENYYSSIPESIFDLSDLYANYDNIYFLEDNNIKIEGVVFVGATMWTDMNRNCPKTMFAAKNGMNDYRLIKNAKGVPITPEYTVKEHSNSVRYIKTISEKAKIDNTPVVVVTHHAPCSLSISEKSLNNQLNRAYYSELSDMILDNPIIHTWVHGHTHSSKRYNLGSTEVICNPRGYQSRVHCENTGFDVNLTFEIKN